MFYCVNRFGNLPPFRETVPEKVVLGLLLVLTLLLCFPFLGQNFTGFQNDEANNLLGALDVLQGKMRSPFIGELNFSTLPYFLLAPFIKVFGLKLAAGRGAAAFLSVIGVYFFYRWCRLYFGIMASGLAAFFFSYCWWNLFNSLSPFLHISTVLFDISCFLFLAMALKTGRRLYFGLSGLFMALCFMSYIAWPSDAVHGGFGFIGMLLDRGRKVPQGLLETFPVYDFLLFVANRTISGEYDRTP